jgi:hypothetical protein
MILPDRPLWLEVAHRASYILLLTVIVLSFANLAIAPLRKRWSKGKIHLDGGFVAHTRKGLFSKLLLEHIDSDIAGDGVPVNLPKFWSRVSVASGPL